MTHGVWCGYAEVSWCTGVSGQAEAEAEAEAELLFLQTVDRA